MALSIVLLTSSICLFFCFQQSLCDARPNFREIFVNELLHDDTYLNPSSVKKETSRSVNYREFFLGRPYQQTFIERSSGYNGLKAFRTKDFNCQCQNNGSCYNSTCFCKSGYSGQFCQNRTTSSSGMFTVLRMDTLAYATILEINYLIFFLETSNKNSSTFNEMTNLTYDVWWRLSNNNSPNNGMLAEIRKNDITIDKSDIISSNQMLAALLKLKNYENATIGANITGAFTASYSSLINDVGYGAVVLLTDGIPEDRESAISAAQDFNNSNFDLFVVLCNGNDTMGQKFAQNWTAPYNIFVLNKQSNDEIAANISERITNHFATTSSSNPISATQFTSEEPTGWNFNPSATLIALNFNISAGWNSTTTTAFSFLPSSTTRAMGTTENVTTTRSASSTPTVITSSNPTSHTATMSPSTTSHISTTTTSPSTTSHISTTKVTTTVVTHSTTSSHTTSSFVGNSGLPTAVITGIIFGSILIIVVFVFFLFYCRYRARYLKSITNLAHKNSSTRRPESYMKSYIRPTKSKEVLNPDYLDGWYLEPNRLVIDKNQVLGSGAFSTVYRARIFGKAPVSNVKQSNLASKQFVDCEVAVKIPPVYADHMAISDFEQEMNLMKVLGYHNHLVSLLGSSTTHDGNPCIITELCSGGNLLYYVRNRKEDVLKAQSQDYQNTLRFRDLLSFAWQICDGMDYLGSKGCIHRDLAARNVLVNAEKTAKVGDFGLCRLMNSAVYTARGGRLPIKWMAIESLQIYEYSFKSDVWSFGVLLHEMFSLGGQPYTTIQPADMIEHLVKGHRLEKPDFCPDEIYQIMTSTWVAEPEERPTFDELRSTFAKLLESATMDYGYLLVTNETAEDKDHIAIGESDI